MKSKRLSLLVLSAMFCALFFIVTWFAIPTPVVGNVNLGDGMILLAAWLLGGPWAIAAAGLGAALCDLAAGYAIYAPATLLIKALMVLTVLGVESLFPKGKRCSRTVRLLGGVAAECVMALGYFAFESTVMGYGWGALANLPFNALQGACGIIVAMLVYELLAHAGFSKKQ